MTVELISIVDCDLCVAPPADEKVSDLPLPATWGRLTTILVRRDWDEPWSPDLARYSSALDIDLEQIRVCRACDTHYNTPAGHLSNVTSAVMPQRICGCVSVSRILMV